jgi:SAM-dependent methyltransferase
MQPKRILEITKLKELYSKNINLIEYMNQDRRFSDLTLQDKIHLSYDLQSGSYSSLYASIEDIKKKSGVKIAQVLSQLEIKTVLDAGTGEGTSLADIILALGSSSSISFSAFDISLSRLLYAQSFFKSKKVFPLVKKIFVSNLTQISLANSSVDLIMTFHALEPNGGYENQIVEELRRVTRKYLLLIEPSWEFACSQQKERMKQHGYVKDIPQVLKENGFKLIRHEPWGLDSNPLNVAALILAEKSNCTNGVSGDFQYSLAGTNEKLIPVLDGHYDKKSCLLYPSISNVDCLLNEQAILVTKYMESKSGDREN